MSAQPPEDGEGGVPRAQALLEVGLQEPRGLLPHPPLGLLPAVGHGGGAGGGGGGRGSLGDERVRGRPQGGVSLVTCKISGGGDGFIIGDWDCGKNKKN